MTTVREALDRAADGWRLATLAEVGGEEALVSDPGLATSPLFGDAAKVLLHHWNDLGATSAAATFISDGLRRNRDRFALNRAIDALAQNLPKQARPFVAALEARARDSTDHDILRATAAAALLRLALLDTRWKSAALAALGALEDTDDVFAGPMVSRLAAVAYEQFGDPEMLAVLDCQSGRGDPGGQASFERGVLQISQALEGGDLPAIAEGLEAAEAGLRRAMEADGERRDAQLYHLVVQNLLPVARGVRPQSSRPADALRELAIMRDLWDAPAPGTEWLMPEPIAELDWAPLADDLHALAHDLSAPSWLDAARVMDRVLRLYATNRAVRPRGAGLARLVQPAIEAAFVRERGLLAHLDQWILHYSGQAVTTAEAGRLRENIQIRATAPPGKSQRMAPGRTPFSAMSRLV